ncbi:hypothetical protein Tco_0983384, partial [Tanacetum coccineum]
SEVVKDLENIMALLGLNPGTESSSSTSASYEGTDNDYSHPYSNDSLFAYNGEKEMASVTVGGTSLMRRNFDSGLYTTYGDAEKEVASCSVGGTNLMQNWFDPGLYSTYGASSAWEYV